MQNERITFRSLIKDGRGVGGGCGVWVWSKDSRKSVLFEPMRKVELPTTTLYCRYLPSLLRSVGHFTGHSHFIYRLYSAVNKHKSAAPITVTSATAKVL